MFDYDIVIVGFGPTGSTLANLLALSNISTCIIEREDSLYNLPRAVHFDDEVMRVFQTIGIANTLRKCGNTLRKYRKTLRKCRKTSQMFLCLHMSFIF